MSERNRLFLMIAAFAAAYFMPVDSPRFQGAVNAAFYMLNDYARLHIVLCLVSAFFIAGAIATFVSQASVMKYLGPNSHKGLAYAVSAVSGTILAVCSCTILPLFIGIYKMGAGLGPGIAFLYSGPAISVLSIILTAWVLGAEIGLARALGAISFSVIIGFIMHMLYLKEENEKARIAAMMPEPEVKRPLWQNILYFTAMVGILVSANFGKPAASEGIWFLIFANKWIITSACAVFLGFILSKYYGVKPADVFTAAIAPIILVFVFPGKPVIPFIAGIAGLGYLCMYGNEEMQAWGESAWGYAKQILPLLLGGVIVSGFLLGMPGKEGIIPNAWISSMVGGNSLSANFFASFMGAFMYLATLTEVPILQGLFASGMGKGPGLALLLAGPSLSLPSMLVINSVLGFKKTSIYVALVIILSTAAGMIFGNI